MYDHDCNVKLLTSRNLRYFHEYMCTTRKRRYYLWSGAHFTNNFSITIQMWWKFHFALIQIWAVVACAKFCRDMITSNWIKAKWNFHRIWIVMEKPLVKWVPDVRVLAGLLSEEDHVRPCKMVFFLWEIKLWERTVPFSKLTLNNTELIVLDTGILSNCHFQISFLRDLPCQH